MSQPLINYSGTNLTLYYSVLEYFKTIMSNHPSIGSVTQGDIFGIDEKEFPIYPLGNTLVTNTTFGATTSNFSIQLTIADKVKLRNNESSGSFNEMSVPFSGVDDVVDIHSNTLAILNDLTAYTQRNIYGIEIDGDIDAIPFRDNFDNGLAGWVCNFDITVHNDKNRCLLDLIPATTTTQGPTTTTTTYSPLTFQTTSSCGQSGLDGDGTITIFDAVGGGSNSYSASISSSTSGFVQYQPYMEFVSLSNGTYNVYVKSSVGAIASQSVALNCLPRPTTTTTSTTTTTLAPTTTTTSGPTTTTTSTTTTTTTFAQCKTTIVTYKGAAVTIQYTDCNTNTKTDTQSGPGYQETYCLYPGTTISVISGSAGNIDINYTNNNCTSPPEPTTTSTTTTTTAGPAKWRVVSCDNVGVTADVQFVGGTLGLDYSKIINITSSFISGCWSLQQPVPTAQYSGAVVGGIFDNCVTCQTYTPTTTTTTTVGPSTTTTTKTPCQAPTLFSASFNSTQAFVSASYPFAPSCYSITLEADTIITFPNPITSSIGCSANLFISGLSSSAIYYIRAKQTCEPGYASLTSSYSNIVSGSTLVATSTTTTTTIAPTTTTTTLARFNFSGSFSYSTSSINIACLENDNCTII